MNVPKLVIIGKEKDAIKRVANLNNGENIRILSIHSFP